MDKRKLLVITVLLVFVSACGPVVGSAMTAKKDIKLIADYNVPTANKPVACYLSKGEQVNILETSSLSCGSGCQETVILVSSTSQTCTGWGFPGDFK